MSKHRERIYWTVLIVAVAAALWLANEYGTSQVEQYLSTTLTG